MNTEMISKKDTVLIIEDEAPIRESMETVLKDAGFEVGTAKDGVEAFHFLSENPETDLITLDLLMPNMSGYEFLHNLADKQFEDLQHIPIIIISAMTNARTIALQKGHKYIGKPLDIETLLEGIREEIATARAKKEKHENGR